MANRVKGYAELRPSVISLSLEPAPISMKTLQQLVELLGQAPNLPTRSASTAPMVTVQMASGARYEGSIHEHSREMIILQGLDGANHYLDAVRVEAITVLDCLALADVFSNGCDGSRSGADLRRAS